MHEHGCMALVVRGGEEPIRLGGQQCFFLAESDTKTIRPPSVPLRSRKKPLSFTR